MRVERQYEASVKGVNLSDPVYLANTEECPPGRALEIVVSNRVIALYNVDGQFHALDGVCPHQGGPLGKGELDAGIVTCPWHGWKFAVKDGKCLISAAIEQPTIQLHVEGDRVFMIEDEN